MDVYSRYIDADDDMVDYLTKHVDDMFDRQEASYEKTRNGAEKLMNLLVAGIGSAALLLFNRASAGGVPVWATVGLAVTLIGWAVCAFYLLKNCIQAQERPTRNIHPSSLYYDDPRTGERVSLRDLRRFMIFDSEEAIQRLTEINRTRAVSLNHVRIATLAVSGIGLCGVLLALLFD